MKIIAALLALSLLPLPAAALAAAARTPEADAQHRALAALAGHWTVTQSLWLDGAATPKIDAGDADFAMVLNGRHLKQTLHINDGTGFEGLGYLGYDSGSGQAFSTWMDVNFPGMVVAWGGFDAGAKGFILTGAMGADKVPVREVMTLTDSDHFRYEFYETHQGRETLAVRLDYTRAPVH